MGAAIRHPFGLTLLVLTLAVAGTLQLMPGLELRQALVPWIVLWGLLAYAVSVIAIAFSRPNPSTPELRSLQAIRQSMATRLAGRRAAEGNNGQSELTRILSEAIVQLDKQVTPALQQLLERQGALSSYLSKIEQGSLPVPDQHVLQRLQAIHARQKAAIEECVQQAANAAGTLVALLQEGDDASVAIQARTWAKDLLTLYDAIAEVLRGRPDDDDFDRIVEQTGTEGSVGVKEPASPPVALRVNGISLDGFPRLVEDALRRLNEPAALSKCELIDRIPFTLATTRTRLGDGQARESTPLKQSQALRDVLGRAIEGLKPTEGAPRPGSPEAIQYSILYEEYMRGVSTASIMVRHSISQTTFYRHRREAIDAVSRELLEQEDLLRQELQRREAEA